MVCEGRAMLLALAADLSSLTGCDVVTTWNSTLGPFPREGIKAVCVASPDEESVVFRELASECDATIVIAPEFDGILTERRQIVLDVGGKNFGPSPDATALCSDKLATFRFLMEKAIPTIETRPLNFQVDDLKFSFPLVMKQRDGAGSLATFLLRNPDDWRDIRSQHGAALDAVSMIQQPFVLGHAVSASAIVSSDRTQIHVFPTGTQMLSQDGRFHYLGGRIPARFAPAVLRAVQTTVRETCFAIDGLSGYVGFDLVVPEDRPACPLIVDVNPRLTTSYVGYRKLATENLAARFLNLVANDNSINWRQGSVQFQPDGSVTFSAETTIETSEN